MGKIINYILSMFNTGKSTGSLESPVDARRIALASFFVPVALPSKYNLDLGEVYNQGSKSCCVGCSVAKLASSKLGVDLSYDDLYGQCKAEDGIPNILGTYPSVGGHIAVRTGISTVEAYNTKDSVKIAESRAKNKMSGYAFVERNFEAICQAIFTGGGVSASFAVDYNWFKGIIMKVLTSVGGHCIVLKGFDIIPQILIGQNSWGNKWIGYIAGILNSDLKGGEFEVRWEDYKDNIYDIMVFTYIPLEVLEDAKKYDYRFMNTLRMGSTGFEVKKLQERLGLKADGSFGTLTRNAVQMFQHQNNLVSDGVVGAGTRKVLNKNVLSLIPTWAKAIQSHEGYYKGSRSFRNNNPANFKSGSLTSYMISLGATGVDAQGFAIFPDYKTGFNALCSFLTQACTNKLKSYRDSMTILDFFNVYAPASDNNDTVAYAKAIAKAVGGTITNKISELL